MILRGSFEVSVIRLTVNLRWVSTRLTFVWQSRYQIKYTIPVASRDAKAFTKNYDNIHQTNNKQYTSVTMMGIPGGKL
jgi:hypothetical protein